MKSTSNLRKRIGCLGWGLRILLAVVIVLVVLLMVGYTYQLRTTAADFQQFSAPGQLVDVGGYRMHIFCQGDGSPTVIVDTGLGDYSDSWSLVQLEVARFSRICHMIAPGTVGVIHIPSPALRSRSLSNCIPSWKKPISRAPITWSVIL